MQVMNGFRSTRAVGIAIILAGLAALLLFSGSLGGVVGLHPELKELEGKELTFDEYVTFFENLAKEKGGAYAYDTLLKADIAPGIDLHLLGHVIGDILYKQEGIDGIYDCTPDFRNACSHSIVVGLFTERGIDALDDIADACGNAPGGTGAYTMCFHGLGHGILAYANYDFGQAVDMCKKTGTPGRQNREYIECVGGTTMEMIAGVHDPNAWKAQYTTYFADSDPLAPCNRPYVSEQAKPICYTYLTPHLFEAAGADLAAPQPEHFKKAFTFCNAIPEDERAARDACYGGFGKEFVVLAQGRDVRDIGSMGEDALRNIRSWCSLADNQIGEIVCNGNALSSLFWGGENNPDASFTFCAIAEDERLQGECYAQLGQMIPFFLKGTVHAGSLCDRLPEPHRRVCRAQM